jgi:hypothetical protein
MGRGKETAEVRMKVAAKILETKPLSQIVSDDCHVLHDPPPEIKRANSGEGVAKICSCIL